MQKVLTSDVKFNGIMNEQCVVSFPWGCKLFIASCALRKVVGHLKSLNSLNPGRPAYTFGAKTKGAYQKSELASPTITSENEMCFFREFSLVYAMHAM